MKPPFYNVVGTRKGVSADGVQNHVNVLGDIFEFLFRIINHHIGSQLCQGLLILR